MNRHELAARIFVRLLGNHDTDGDCQLLPEFMVSESWRLADLFLNDAQKRSSAPPSEQGGY